MLYTSFYNRANSGRGQRKGIVLLLVISMLALFATLALAFVFYAEAEAVSSNTTLQAQSKTVPDADPELLLSYGLSQLIYDTNNYYSVTRGHSLARTMYGSNQVVMGSPPTPTQLGQNYSAYSGIGRLHYPQPSLGGDDYYFPNSQYYPVQYYATDPPPFLRDPEFYGTRANPSVAVPATNYRAGNAPYTYPDMNSMFLARVDADGSVILPSFRRPWAENPTGVSIANRRYVLMFPDGVGYHDGTDGKGNAIAIGPFNTNPNGFGPVDADAGGHVRNLDFSRGSKIVNPATGAVTFANNDSYWLDLGWPTMIAPNGKKYKALFAPLILDLDNRINMWLAGNYNYATKVSNKGYGPNEINPFIKSPINNQPLINNVPINGVNDWQNLMTMRYGAAGMPPAAVPPAQWPQRDGPIYSRIDFDGFNGGALLLPNPANGNNSGYFIWPDYPNGTYPAPNNVPFKPWFSPVGPAPATIPTELLNHPLAYNPWSPAGGNKALPRASHMEAILRYLGTGAPATTSGFFKSMPNTFGTPTTPPANPANSPYALVRNRNLFTSHSWNLDRITGSPYISYPLANNPNYKFNPLVLPYPKMSAPLISPSFNPAAAPTGAPNGPAAGSEFTATYSSALANRLRINLNRISSSAYDYPAPDNTGFIDLTVAANATQFTLAQNARANNTPGVRTGLAYDIYNVLVMVTGAMDPNNPANAGMNLNSPQQYQAARWLAQLAVNIVDYADSDDISTPFNWDQANGDWVFGTEAPRLVINEAYAEIDDGATDPGLVLLSANDSSKWQASTSYNLNAWVELHNPMKNTPGWGTPTSETFPFDNGLARPFVEPVNAKFKKGYAAYELVLSMPDHTNLFAQGNNTGNSTAAAVLTTVGASGSWGPAKTPVWINPAPNGAFSDPVQQAGGPPAPAGPNGFFVLGPATTFLPATPFLVNNVATGTTLATNPFPGKQNQPTFLSPLMTYQMPIAQAATLATVNTLTTTGTTMLLRRLACPYIRPNNNPGPNYNPYITVDFVENVKTWDNRVATPTVVLANQPPAVTNFSTIVRQEPYAASYMGTNRNQFTTIPAQSSNVGTVLNTSAQYTNTVGNNPGNFPVDQPPGQALNTFFRHNSTTIAPPTAGPTFNMPFNWLVHLDRPVVNSLELLHVSAFPPHQLTQQFSAATVQANGAVPPPTLFQHYAPWQDPNAVIYRALELLGVPSYLNGTALGGRVPGKININTMNAMEVWLALCDAQNAPQNNFSTGLTPAQVQTLFTNVLQSRTPGGAPGPNDIPFRSFATGFVANTSATTPDTQYQYGSGIDDTLLRTTAAPPTQNLSTANQPNPPFSNLLLTVGTAANHPYQRLELLQKILNNTTTTSNVFAVWLTVGFFEVDDTFTPPKIGSEIGRDQGRQIRHRMFSIVDRSALTLFQVPGGAKQAITAGSTVSLTTLMPAAGPVNPLPQLQMTNGATWSLQAGMLLEIGTPGNMEVVVVQPGLTATFNGQPIGGNWPAGTPIKCRGNPGPWPTFMQTPPPPNQMLYDHRLDMYNSLTDTGTVLHYSIIQ